MVDAQQHAQANRFALSGSVAPLAKGDGAYMPRRRLGGWLATYGKLSPSGGLVPTEDREGHTFEAARTFGGIDFSEYRKRGLWNDTHHFNGQAFVGVPTVLEHHDEESPLAKSHGKVGWWTEGHLWDREDPRSWTDFTDYVPNETDFERADYYWKAANLLKGVPRDLGFSAHGKMLLSPCGKRIIWAAVTECAVCELPQNPDATAQLLTLAVKVTPRMLGADPCDRCSCPPNLRCPPLVADRGVAVPPPSQPGVSQSDRRVPEGGGFDLNKADGGSAPVQGATGVGSSGAGDRGAVSDATIDAINRESLEGNDEKRDPAPRDEVVERVAKLIARKMGCSEEDARRWLKGWAQARTRGRAT